MFKLTAIVSLMLIATWSQVDSRRHKKDAFEPRDFDSGTTMWAASLSCDSCGSECTSACGTRQFRSCCFNYLRRKRGPDAVKFIPQNINEIPDIQEKKYPAYIENSEWLNMVPEYRRYDDLERLFDV